jgi:hypothetical protein
MGASRVQLLRLAARCGGAKCAGGACSSSSSSFVSTQGPECGHEAPVEAFQLLGGLTTAGATASDEAVKISSTVVWLHGRVPRRRAEKVHASQEGARTLPEQVPSRVDLSLRKQFRQFRQFKHTVPPYGTTDGRYLPRARVPGRRCVVPIPIRTPPEAGRCDRTKPSIKPSSLQEELASLRQRHPSFACSLSF